MLSLDYNFLTWPHGLLAECTQRNWLTFQCFLRFFSHGRAFPRRDHVSHCIYFSFVLSRLDRSSSWSASQFKIQIAGGKKRTFVLAAPVHFLPVSVAFTPAAYGTWSHWVDLWRVGRLARLQQGGGGDGAPHRL